MSALNDSLTVYTAWTNLTPKQQTWARIKLPSDSLSLLNDIIDFYSRSTNPVDGEIEMQSIMMYKYGIFALADMLDIDYDFNRQALVSKGKLND